MTGGGPIAYAGEAGAFAEDAALAAFGQARRLPTPGFAEVFEAVEGGSAAAGVVPIENLVNGTVREVYDLLLEHDLRVVGEVVVPVVLCLATLPGQRLEDVERVYSHVQALGQAERYLRSHGWALLTTYNTAGAGKLIAARAEVGAAALLSRRAAAVFGLEVLADSVQDVADNRTRFLVVARPDSGIQLPGRDDAPHRTMLAFGVRNEPGTLLAVLRVFADRGINLSNLESRPSRSAAWEYVFWADLDADAREPSVAAAVAEARAVATMVRVFGSYPRAEVSRPASRAR